MGQSVRERETEKEIGREEPHRRKRQGKMERKRQ
jgi:hypothetical protein